MPAFAAARSLDLRRARADGDGPSADRVTVLTEERTEPNASSCLFRPGTEFGP